MSDAWIRRLVMLTTVLVVLHAVGMWTFATLGLAAALASVALVAAVSFFSARMAGLGDGNHAWFIIPTLVFTLVPLAARVWTLVTVADSRWVHALEVLPFLAGFALPVLLLLLVYRALSVEPRSA